MISMGQNLISRVIVMFLPSIAHPEQKGERERKGLSTAARDATMGLTKHPDKPKGECVMEFRDKPMQNLIRIKEKEICKNVQALLLDGESIVGAYKTVRDQVVFTSHRIFMVDMQGVTGTRQEIFVLPYRKIVHFGIQTAGFGDPLQTSELTVCYADEHEMKFGFIGQEELLAVARAISRCIL